MLTLNDMKLLTMCVVVVAMTLTVGMVDADANPRSFTDDPFVDDEKFQEIASRHEILAIEGEKAVIPCDVSTPDQLSDRPKLILWYKGKNKVPIYSFDLRKTSSGHHWKDNNTLGMRGFVYYEESPLGQGRSQSPQEVRWTSNLHLEPVHRGDAGKYRCRVDFTISPTFNSWVKLKVIVPPSAPVLENDRGDQLYGETDPLREGSSLVLHCHSAGNPVPSLSWRLGGIPLQPSSVHTDSSTGQIRSTITLKEIGGKDRGKDVECSAYNNDLTPPGKVTARVRVISPPGRVKIVREKESFTAGEQYNLTCQALGSSPVPEVRVLSGSTLLPLVYSQESPDGTVYSAVVQFNPTQEDHDKFLVCTAVNKLLPQAAIEDQWKLDVRYGPTVRLLVSTRVGNATRDLSQYDDTVEYIEDTESHEDEARTDYEDRLEAVEIVERVEGENIYMRCDIQSNPPFQAVHWFLQDRDLERYGFSNFYVVGPQLSAKQLQWDQAGTYYCSATNGVKTVVSKPVRLNVLAVPTCSQSPNPANISLQLHHTGQITCHMRLPDGVINNGAMSRQVNFYWTHFMEKDGMVVVSRNLSRAEFSQSGLTSRLRYTANGPEDFGRVECRAEISGDGVSSANNVARPCVFHVHRLADSANAALQIHCKSINQTISSFTVECTQPTSTMQQLNYQVYDSQSHEMISNLTTSADRLNVSNLSPATFYTVYVSPLHQEEHQPRQPVILEAFTLGSGKTPSPLTGQSNNPARFLPILGVLGGILVVLAALTIAVTILIRRKLRLNRENSNSTGSGGSQSPQQQQLQSKQKKEGSEETGEWYQDPSTSSPDLIPRLNATEVEWKELDPFVGSSDGRQLAEVNTFIPAYSTDSSQVTSLEYVGSSDSIPVQTVGSPTSASIYAARSPTTPQFGSAGGSVSAAGPQYAGGPAPFHYTTFQGRGGEGGLEFPPNISATMERKKCANCMSRGDHGKQEQTLGHVILSSEDLQRSQSTLNRSSGKRVQFAESPPTKSHSATLPGKGKHAGQSHLADKNCTKCQASAAASKVTQPNSKTKASCSLVQDVESKV